MLTVIVWCLIGGYLAYFALWYSRGPRSWVLELVPGRRGRILEASLQKVLMFAFLGLAPALVVYRLFGRPPSHFGLTVGDGAPRIWLIAAGLSVVAFAVGFFNPAHARAEGQYPQMKVAEWTVGLWLFNAAGLGLYLLAYEFMYRGLLLIPLLELGVAPAVALNTALYMATHLHKGLSEAVAAVPFGVLLCVLTLEGGSMLPAFLVHWFLAAGNSLGAVVRGPEYHFV